MYITNGWFDGGMKMQKNMNARCIDVNTSYCPCFLAQTNHCFVCSHLKGGILCDCNWTGSCILYEKHWQRKTNSCREPGATIRREIEADINIIQQISNNAYLVEIKVGLQLAQELKKIGSFVFLRCLEDPDFYLFPVGVMKVENDCIQVVIETIGPKSSKIFANDIKKIYVRGPYYNGVFGQPWIDNIKCGKIIVIAGGMGQAPALPIIEYLSINNNNITAVLAPGKLGKVFIANKLLNMSIEVYAVASLRREGMPLVRQLFQSANTSPELVVSAGSDEQHYGVIAAMQAAEVNIPMAATNNATMCCGEGICGSCEKETKSGQRIRACKVQLPFTSLHSNNT